MAQRYQFLPPLTPEEYAALKADIAANGVRVPIERNGDGEIIDGFNRAQICEELGIECPANIRKGLTEIEKRELALSLNLARRHLSRDQKQALAIQLRQEGWTQERIAHVLCVTQGTVSTWLVQFIDSDKLNAPTKVQGKDGKQYSGRKRHRTPGWRRRRAEGTGPEAPTGSPDVQAPDQTEDSSTTREPIPSSAPPDGQVPHGHTSPMTCKDHVALHGMSPNTSVLHADAVGMDMVPENHSLQDEVVDPIAHPLLGLVGALHAHLQNNGDLDELGRISRSWSREVQADFIEKSTYIIRQLQAIHQGLEQAVVHDHVAPDAEVAPQDDDHGIGEGSTGTITDDNERALVGVEPDVIDEVSMHTIVDTTHGNVTDESHPEAPTGEPDDASDENGAGIPEEGAAAQRLEAFAGYGLSNRAVARRLNEEGLACPRGNGRWDHRKVARALERMRRGATTVS